ncbi:MAG: protein of unknown function DUF1814 [Candidatus Magasanikbacteria bacterium]|nr:protein of unknown function DUF1814 [Candidatus Magasanikbacteria bacterium]
MMHIKTLNKATQAVFKKLRRATFIKNFYLAGGTALALQYGHRESMDLDFFSARKFQSESLIALLTKLGTFKLVNEEAGTVDGIERARRFRSSLLKGASAPLNTLPQQKWEPPGSQTLPVQIPSPLSIQKTPPHGRDLLYGGPDGI